MQGIWINSNNFLLDASKSSQKFQNISRSRGGVWMPTSLQRMPWENVLSYDGTNCSDDSGFH